MHHELCKGKMMVGSESGGEGDGGEGDEGEVGGGRVVSQVLIFSPALGQFILDSSSSQRNSGSAQFPLRSVQIGHAWGCSGRSISRLPTHGTTLILPAFTDTGPSVIGLVLNYYRVHRRATPVIPSGLPCFFSSLNSPTVFSLLPPFIDMLKLVE